MKNNLKILMLVALTLSLVFTSCKKDGHSDEKPLQKEPFAMVYEDFIMPDDVQITSPDTTTISVSVEYADKLGVNNFDGRTVTIWRTIGTVPFIRNIVSSSVDNDRIILNTVRGSFSDMFSDLEVTMDTDLYINHDYKTKMSTRAGLNVTDISDKYTDEDGVLHPVVIIFEEPEDLSKSIATRAGIEEKNYYTAEELLANNLDIDIIDFSTTLDLNFTYPPLDTTNTAGVGFVGKAGLGAKFGAFVHLKVGLSGIKKCEFGIRGGLDLNAKLGLGVKGQYKKEWEKSLKKFPKKTSVFMIGPVPVAFTFESELKNKAEFKSTATAQVLASAWYETEFDTGWSYKKGDGWKKIGKTTKTDKGFQVDGVNGTATFEASVGHYFEVGFYLGGSIGPSLAVGPVFSAESELSATINPFTKHTIMSASIGAGAGLNAEFEAKIKILGYPLAKWTTSVRLIYFKLFEASIKWEYKNDWSEIEAAWMHVLDSSDWMEDADIPKPIENNSTPGTTSVPYRLPNIETGI